MTIQIKHYCRILPNQFFLNGNKRFESTQKPVEIHSFFSEIYHHLGIDYRKFFKMDALSKAGFLASELLLSEFDREQPKEDMGIIFFNQSSSLDSDETYQQTIREKDNFFPSPAVFVYTLPNIVAGEIAIRHKIHGETAFYVLPRFQAGVIEETVKSAFHHTGLKYLLTGWIEIYKGEIDICTMLCEAGEKGALVFNSANLGGLYTHFES
ncbi:MAG: hypothetical protein LBE79_03265 [Tannerella sp.]|jgi:hypothetical protein|nr:hypothetical protein [Tannerella sp.]